jgi:hypothetical protein
MELVLSQQKFWDARFIDEYPFFIVLARQRMIRNAAKGHLHK